MQETNTTTETFTTKQLDQIIADMVDPEQQAIFETEIYNKKVMLYISQHGVTAVYMWPKVKHGGYYHRSFFRTDFPTATLACADFNISETAQWNRFVIAEGRLAIASATP